MGHMDIKAPVTNQRVADDLGITHSMVSRIRSGDRQPSIALGAKIAAMFDWTLDEQAKAMAQGNYGSLFEQRLDHHYGE